MIRKIKQWIKTNNANYGIIIFNNQSFPIIKESHYKNIFITNTVNFIYLTKLVKVIINNDYNYQKDLKKEDNIKELDKIRKWKNEKYEKMLQTYNKKLISFDTNAKKIEDGISNIKKIKEDYFQLWKDEIENLMKLVN